MGKKIREASSGPSLLHLRFPILFIYKTIKKSGQESFAWLWLCWIPHAHLLSVHFWMESHLIHWTTTTKEISEQQKCAKSWGRPEDSKTKKQKACLQGHSLKLRFSSMHSDHFKRWKCRFPGHTLPRQTMLSKTLVYKTCGNCCDRWTHLGITESDPRREAVGAEEWGTQPIPEGQERIPGKEVNCWPLKSRINLEVTPCPRAGMAQNQEHVQCFWKSPNTGHKVPTPAARKQQCTWA